MERESRRIRATDGVGPTWSQPVTVDIDVGAAVYGGSMIDAPGQRLLITDLDNTLWDWFEAWYQSFSGMLTRLHELSGVDQAVLEAQIRSVHQDRGTSEYSNLFREVPALVAAAGPNDAAVVFDEAQHIQNSRRKAATRLYPGVRDALLTLKQAGVAIVAFTESGAYWTEWRIRHTRLDGIIDVLYSAPDHLPDGMRPEDLRTGHVPAQTYGLKFTQHHKVPDGVHKPDPTILRSILADQHCEPAQAVYIGDSLMKDIAMAQATGVLDVHARYGQVQDKPEYELLRRVTHWSKENVEREKTLMRGTGDVVPTITCAERFDEVLDVFSLPRVSTS